MKQILAKKGGIILANVSEPVCKHNEVKVKVHFSAVSIGTELNTIKKLTQPLYKTALQNTDLIQKMVKKALKEGPLNALNATKNTIKKNYSLGYSCAGEVIEVGKNVEGFIIGDKVACGGQNYANHAEIVCVPKNLVVKVPYSVNLEEAAHTTIGAIAIQSIRRLNPTFGETVVVYGLGLLGTIITRILTAIGCKVIGIGRKRIEYATTHVTFTKDIVENVHNYTKDIGGADGVIVAVAAKDKTILNNAMDMCRKKGRVVLVGDVPITIDRQKMFRKEIDFRISTSYGPGRYDPVYEEEGRDYPIAYVRWTQNRNMQEFLRLLSEKKITVQDLIQKQVSISNAVEAYEDLKKRETNEYGIQILKIILNIVILVFQV